MDFNYYKHCIVPQCKSTTRKTPEKLFFYVPHKKLIRRKWLQLARRDTQVSSISRMYFCEDHFDLPNDMENYIRYQIMGSVPQLRLKPGCLPHKFDCQPDRKRRSSSVDRPYIIKKERIIEECLNEAIESNETSTSGISLVPLETSNTTSVMIKEEDIDIMETADKSIQVRITHKYRSKFTQTNTKSVDRATSPFEASTKSISTSPFSVEHSTKTEPSGSGRIKIKMEIFSDEDQSDSTSHTSQLPHTDSSSSTDSQTKYSLVSSEFVKEKHKSKSSVVIDNTVNNITNKTLFYIGVPKECYFLIDIIVTETNIPMHHLLLCLKKIRLDSKFNELADDFAVTPTYASIIFLKNVPKIASVMRPFVVKLDLVKTLPTAFKDKYNNVTCIIDSLEIEIQKPSEAVNQAHTWSEYKKAHTMKYLISCTPNGLVNYVSPGFGGRITNACLVETCNFMQCVTDGMCVIAYGGFKDVEQLLQESGVQLVRPPSVGGTLTKFEAKETKQIADLRVKGVIGRLCEFNMLKPHACINLNFVNILDDIITIACGIINVQESLIQ